jgi:hypothetical protein
VGEDVEIRETFGPSFFVLKRGGRGLQPFETLLHAKFWQNLTNQG